MSVYIRIFDAILARGFIKKTTIHTIYLQTKHFMKHFFLSASLSVLTLTSFAQWSAPASNNIYTLNSGNVGIGTTTPQAKFSIAPGTLGSTAGSKLLTSIYETGLGYNTSMLDISTIRYADGNDWLSATTRIQQRIDATPMGFIDFNPKYGAWGVALGAGEYTSVFVHNTGNVGIGGSAAGAKLEVNGGQIISTAGTSANSRTLTMLASGTSQVNFGSYPGAWRSSIQLQNNDASMGLFMAPPDPSYAYSHIRSIKGGFRFDVGGDFTSAGLNALAIEANGQVGIGIAAFPTGHKLAVGGSIIAEKVKVSLQPWADYVFEPTYQLPTLEEVAAFIKQNKHLPGVPSAAEVEKNGLDLGDNQATLLKKIEELTLYIIDQDKQQQKQMQMLQIQEKLIKQQTEAIDQLKQQMELLKKASN